MRTARIIVDLVYDDAIDDELVEVETEGNIPFVTALGMLRMAELELVDRTSRDDEEDGEQS